MLITPGYISVLVTGPYMQGKTGQYLRQKRPTAALVEGARIVPEPAR